jgi:hypothetical protein
MLRYAHTVGKQIHLAIVALQCALRMLRHLEILSETLSNCALCTSWAFGLQPKNLSQNKLGVKCIGILRKLFPVLSLRSLMHEFEPVKNRITCMR